MSKALAPSPQENEGQVGAAGIAGNGDHGDVGHKQLLEELMKFIGFAHEHISPHCIQGRFVVNENSSQVFGVLHGGISAFIAESLASFGAHIASGFQRVAGLQLSINHLRDVPVGTEVFVSAKPSQIGKRVQVWDVTFSKVADSMEPNDVDGSKIAVSRVTLMTGLSGQAKEYFQQGLKLHARL